MLILNKFENKKFLKLKFVKREKEIIRIFRGVFYIINILIKEFDIIWNYVILFLYLKY